MLKIPSRIKALLTVAIVALTGCAGSAVHISSLSHSELVKYYEDKFTTKNACSKWRQYGTVENCRRYVKSQNAPQHVNLCPKVSSAWNTAVKNKGFDTLACEDPERFVFESEWATETYNIDLLKIETHSRKDPIRWNKPIPCSSGNIHRIILSGEIGPDSSFSIERLLQRLEPCRDASGTISVPPTVSLRSGGGLLEDGYKLGQTLRQYGATSVIERDQVCASSCAVAFLGGTKRIVENGGAILFHAPYYKGRNEYSSERVNCDVGDAALNELLDYYQTITDKETGSRLFDRTMTYCSAEDGWVVTGGAAAELFGIATEK